MIRTLVTIFAALLGLAFGSFLNVFLTRWPQEESVVEPRSHCRHCSHTLTWWENIPLLSWIMLRGRCSQCRSWIGLRYPLVECAIGALWAAAVWNSYDAIVALDQPTLAVCRAIIGVAGQALFDWLMVALAVLDAEHLWLPNVITLPGTAIGFVLSVTMATLGTFPPANNTETWMHAITRSAGFFAISILAAAGLILLIRWTYWLVRRREGIGLGDAKLMAMIAAWLGLPLTLLTFGISSILGTIAAFVVIAVPAARTDAESWTTSKLPFGTFLCIGAIISSLWGGPIISAYLRLAGF